MKMKKIATSIKFIISLPKVKIKFCEYTKDTIDNYKKTYNYFSKLHRLKLFRNKTLGVALIDLSKYKKFEEYYQSINGKHSAAYYSRRAKRKNYHFREIERNEYVDDIYEINTSMAQRQGRRMSEKYLKKVDNYKDENNYRYFGVLVPQEGKKDKLVSYCNVGFYGEFCLISTLLGHKKYLNDRIMYLMMVELNELIFTEYKDLGYRYIMYDTFYGASDGLKQFKNKLDYKPYKVKWIWEK